MDFVDKIGQGVKQTTSYVGKFMLGGGHAQQDLPAKHRLYSAAGMFVGWAAFDQLRDIVFGVNQVSEGEFVEIKRDDVPKPLQFLHRAIDWNPASDAPSDQWKKVAHQMFPAIGAALGTVAGSMYATKDAGQNFAKSKNAGLLMLLDADTASQYAQTRSMRALTAAFGGFSAASMLPLLYGAFLNLSFLAANAGRIILGDLAGGSFASAKALDANIKNIPAYVKALDGTNDKKISYKLAENLINQVIKPMYGKDLENPTVQAAIREKIGSVFEQSFRANKAKGLSGNELASAVKADMDKFVGREHFDSALKELGLHPKQAKLGNAIPLLRKFHEVLAEFGIVKHPDSWLETVAPVGKGAHDLSPVGRA